MSEKIVITGMGAVTPVGVGVEAYWNGLLSGRCGIRGIDAAFGVDTSRWPAHRAGIASDFDPKERLSAKLCSDLDRFQQLAYVSAVEAIEHSGVAAGGASGRDPRIGITMGSALHGLSLTCETQSGQDSGNSAGPRFISKIMGNMAAALLGINYGFSGPSMTVSTACSSGGDAVTLAAMFLRSGQADAMVAMAGESTIDELFITSLTKAGAMSRAGESKPFDAARSGFVVGEGGGALVLETLSHAEARGAKVLAELAGCANGSDAFHPVSPHPDGDGAVLCMKSALAQAGLAPSDIGFVKAHGTATQKGDSAESNALERVFGANRVPVSSLKGATGHMLASGGVTELIACVKAIETGILPPTIGCDTPDPVCRVDLVRDTPRRADISAAMSNAFGFGGQNSCVIVRRF